MNEKQYDVIILGAGPAGLTAGIYLSRAKVKTLIIDEAMPGGQLILTYEIANYPGIEQTSGFMLSKTMRKQAADFGCTILTNTKIKNADFRAAAKTIETQKGDIFSAKAVILATGGRSRNLGVVGENKFKGRGISYCATCDGDFYQDKEIIVVGGGNSALEEAVSLSKYASKITVVHQFNNWQAFEYAIEEAEKNPKIEFLMESKVVEFFGKESLEKVKIENQKTEEISEKSIEGVFIFIGYQANTEFLKNSTQLPDNVDIINKWGEIIANENMETEIAGIFAAGDARAKKIRQITTAVSDGTVAALSAIEYIQK